MTVAISVRLPEFTAQRLEELAKRTNLSKTDLIIQGLESIFATQFDRKVAYLSDKQFEEVLDFLNRPAASDVEEKLDKTMNHAYPWSRK